MAAELDDAVISGVVNANFKVLGEMPAHTVGLAMQNAVSHQQAMNQLSVAALGSVVRQLTEIGAEESAGLASILQQALKGAQTSLPETGQG